MTKTPFLFYNRSHAYIVKIVLHILGAPHEPPEITEHHYNLLYGDLEKPPDFTRDHTTGEYRAHTCTRSTRQA